MRLLDEKSTGTLGYGMKKWINKYKHMPDPVKASAWFVICGFLQRGISLLTTPIFSRLLSTSEYGIFSVYNTWSGIILIFASLNLASGIYVRGLVKYEHDSEEFTASLQSLYVLNMTIVFGIYAVFSDFWSSLLDLPKSYLYLLFVDMYMTTAFHFWSARQRVEYKYKRLVQLTLTNTVLKPTLGIVAVLTFQDKVFGRITAIAAADIFTFGFLFLRMFLKPGKRVSNKYWKYALAYNLPLVPHYLSQVVLNQSDRIMIKSMVGSSEAGIYSLAYSAASILLIVNQSILNSYNPWMYKKIKSGDYNPIHSVSVMLLLLIAVVNYLVIAFAPEIIAVLAPSEYYEAIWIIPPVSMSVFFTFMYSMFSNFEFYFEKTRLMMYASVSGAVLNIILNSIFIRIFGYMAAGYTTLVCYICYCVFHYSVMQHILKRQLNGKVIYKISSIMLISICIIAASFAMMVLYKHIVIRYSILTLGIVVAVVFRKKVMRTLKSIYMLKEQ